MNRGSPWEGYQYYGGPAPPHFLEFSTDEIWQWVDRGTMVDDGIHPWNPDFRFLLTGIVLADLAKYSSPSLTKEMLGIAAKQIALASNGIINQIRDFADTLKE